MSTRPIGAELEDLRRDETWPSPSTNGPRSSTLANTFHARTRFRVRPGQAAGPPLRARQTPRGCPKDACSSVPRPAQQQVPSTTDGYSRPDAGCLSLALGRWQSCSSSVSRPTPSPLYSESIALANQIGAESHRRTSATAQDDPAAPRGPEPGSRRAATRRDGARSDSMAAG